MGNLGFMIKKFFQNKNTVTIIGVILITCILYFGYNWRIQQKTTPVKMPYAITDIQPKTKITEDMIGYVDVLPEMVKSSVITDVKFIVGKWSNYNTMIPSGSLFYSSAVVATDELPDSALIKIPQGYKPYNLSVDTKSTYGNSIFPDNYIDLYLKVLDEDGNPAVGKLIENVKVLAVKDSSGRNVFENSDEQRTPSIILFAVPEEMHLLLRQIEYLKSDRSVSAELLPVPSTESYSAEPGTVKLASTELKTYIELHAGNFTKDETPEIYDPEIEQ